MIPYPEDPRRAAPHPVVKVIAPAAAVSVLVHALAIVILAYWTLEPATRRQLATPLSVRIERVLPPASRQGTAESRPAGSIPQTGAREREVVGAEPKMPAATDGSPAVADSRPATREPVPAEEPSELGGERLSDRVARSIARIVQELDEQDLRFGSAPGAAPANPPLWFGSRQYRENGAGGDRYPRPGASVEVTGISGDYARVRVGNRCWWLPVDAGSDPFDVKIALLDTDCPARTVIGLVP